MQYGVNEIHIFEITVYRTVTNSMLKYFISYKIVAIAQG